MLTVVDEFRRRPQSAVAHMVAAMTIWGEIWKRLGPSPSVQDLAQELTDREAEFDQMCGGGTLGREFITLTGIAQFYDADSGGFREHTLRQARLVVRAFVECGCSQEAKEEADYLAEIFETYETYPWDPVPGRPSSES